MDEQIQQALFFIDDALKNGATSEQINAYVGTLEPNLRERVRLTQAQQIPGGAGGDFARMALQGATFGFADEMIGLFAGDEAKERSRQNLSVRRGTSPGASLMSEVAGGVALPVGAFGQPAAQAARAGRTGQLIRGGALVGAAEGALVGAGESDAETLLGRVGGAAVGAGVGAAGGAVAAPVVGAGGAAARAGSRRARGLIDRIVGTDRRGAGPRIAESLVQHSGIEGNINQALEVVDKDLGRISDEVFGPLDEQFGEIDDLAVSRFLKEMADNKDIRTVVPRSIRDGDRQPSLSDLQEMRTKLRKRGRPDDADELTEIMEEVFGEEFIGANAEWRRLSGLRRALEQGEKDAALSGQRLERKLNALTGEERAAYQQGRMSRIIEGLTRRETGSVGQAKTFLDPGESTRQQLRSFFETDAAFNGFMDELEVIAADGGPGTAGQANRLAKWILPASIVGGGATGGLVNFITGR